MTTTTDTALLTHYDDEDIFDVVIQLEKSFGLSFAKDAFTHVKTFGDLCAVFEEHIGYPHRDDCTSQQAFYQMRRAIGAAQQIDEKQITPDSLLAELFPKRDRRQKIKSFQVQLGIKVNLLTYPDGLALLLAAGLVLSLVAFFFDWKIALSGLAFFIAAFKIAGKLGKKLQFKTIRELTQQLAQEHYAAIRRHKGTVNKKEIRQTIVSTFSRHLDIKPEQLTHDATFSWA